MDAITKAPGIKGMLQTFVKIVSQCPENKTIAFIGLPYTCTPFIDLFVYAVRKVTTDTYYVKSKDPSDMLRLTLSDVRVSHQEGCVGKADIIVVMGGVAMPNNDWTPDDVNAIIDSLSHEKTSVVGACFMDMFEKAGWIGKVDFTYREECYLSTDAL